MKIKYPKIHSDNNGLVFISFYINKKRYRLYNGNRIKSTTTPNSFPKKERIKIGKILAAETYEYLISGGKLYNYRNNDLVNDKTNDKEIIKNAFHKIINEKYSSGYKSMLLYTYKLINKAILDNTLSNELLINELNHFENNTTFNTVKRHLNVILNKAIELGLDDNPLRLVRFKRTKAKLHKPFNNLIEVLDEIKNFNYNLYLCSLMTYGCLLRPHREIRMLSWGDFSYDLKQINLPGNRNKSGKNRIVPVPYYVKEILKKKDKNLNVFSKSEKAFNKDYFKTIWTRFKKVSRTVEPNQTLYSFRHTGAIEIFKRTGSIHKLQRAMGHSSLNVSLTYLRGLEVAELEEEDMPMI